MDQGSFGKGSGVEKQSDSAVKVLLLAAACNPYKGSDYRVGWHRVHETARYFNTWVICSEADKEDIQRYQRDHGAHPNLQFCFVPDGWLERLLKLRRPVFYTNFFSYHLWHRRAYKLAVRLHRELRFALTHQVTLVGYREPGYLWKLDVPFIWGPVGGTQNYPWRFLPSAGLRGAVVEGFRSLANWLQLRFSPRVRRAARKAAVVLAANSQVQSDFQRLHRVKAELLPDIGYPKFHPKKGGHPGPIGHCIFYGAAYSSITKLCICFSRLWRKFPPDSGMN